MSKMKITPREELRRNLRKRLEKNNVVSLADYVKKTKNLRMKPEIGKTVRSAEILLFLGVQYDRQNQNAFQSKEGLARRRQQEA